MFVYIDWLLKSRYRFDLFHCVFLQCSYYKVCSTCLLDWKRFVGLKKVPSALAKIFLSDNCNIIGIQVFVKENYYCRNTCSQSFRIKTNIFYLRIYYGNFYRQGSNDKAASKFGLDDAPLNICCTKLVSALVNGVNKQLPDEVIRWFFFKFAMISFRIG